MLALLGCCCRVSGCAVCTDGGWHRPGLAQPLTLLGLVRGRRRQSSHGQANPPGFQEEKSPSSALPPGSASHPRSGYRERKALTVRTHEACTDRSFPWGLPKLRKSRCGWSPQGGFLWMLLDFSLWEQGSKERSCVNQPRRSSSSCHTQPCKARLKPEQVLLLPCPPLSHWPARSYGEARKGRVDVPQPHILACAREQRKLLQRGHT